MSAIGGLRDMPFKRGHFRFRHKADLENVAQHAAMRCAPVDSYAYLRRLGCPLDQRLQRSDGRLDVLPSHPQAPRQHRIGRVRQVANSARASSCSMSTVSSSTERERLPISVAIFSPLTAAVPRSVSGRYEFAIGSLCAGLFWYALAAHSG